MELISASERRPQSTQAIVMLDDAEMAFALQELGDAISGSAVSHTLMSPDLLTEYASAASMIMDKEEREEVARQLQDALRNHPVAA